MLTKGELSRSLLTQGLWATLKLSDQTLMLALLQDFKLLRRLDEHGNEERFVVPAMLPNESLPPEFLMPLWWQPSKADTAARIQDAGAERPAAVRIKYEVIGGKLPFGFMGELQVSLVQSDNAGDPDVMQHCVPEEVLLSRRISIEEERVVGSVLCERRGNTREWVVLSQHHGSALHVMAWAELIEAHQSATTDWRLFRHVREQIKNAAEQRVPGLTLREMACYVDISDGTLAKPFDLSRLRRNQEYIRFELDGGGSTDVKLSHVLPCEDDVQLVPSQAAHEG